MLARTDKTDKNRTVMHGLGNKVVVDLHCRALCTTITVIDEKTTTSALMKRCLLCAEDGKTKRKRVWATIYSEKRSATATATRAKG